jgi:hypothetical protein
MDNPTITAKSRITRLSQARLSGGIGSTRANYEEAKRDDEQDELNFLAIQFGDIYVDLVHHLFHGLISLFKAAIIFEYGLPTHRLKEPAARVGADRDLISFIDGLIVTF